MRNVLKLFNWELGVEELIPSHREVKRRDRESQPFQYAILNFHLRKRCFRLYGEQLETLLEAWDVGLDRDENKVIFYADD